MLDGVGQVEHSESRSRDKDSHWSLMVPQKCGAIERGATSVTLWCLKVAKVSPIHVRWRFTTIPYYSCCKAGKIENCYFDKILGFSYFLCEIYDDT